MINDEPIAEINSQLFDEVFDRELDKLMRNIEFRGRE